MPNIASVLKAEISRVARKEIRTELERLHSAVSKQRSDIATLKRLTQTLEKQLRQVEKAKPRATPAAEEEPGKSLRFSAKGLAAQRQRLGLSADDVGLLLGTSGQSIYNWEAGKARPRAKHLPAIAALRTLGKKGAAAALATLKTGA